MQSSGMGRRDRVLAIDPGDSMLSEEARLRLFGEKEEATKLARVLAEDAVKLSNELPSNLARMFDAFGWLPIFARQFELATKATFFAARGRKEDRKALSKLAVSLMELKSEIAQRLEEPSKEQPHLTQLLFDPKQIDSFVASLEVE